MTIGSRRPHRTAKLLASKNSSYRTRRVRCPSGRRIESIEQGRPRVLAFTVGCLSRDSGMRAFRGTSCRMGDASGASRAPSDCTASVEESAGGGCLKVASTNDCISSGQTSWIHLWREQGAVNFTLSLLGHTEGHTVTKLPIYVSR